MPPEPRKYPPRNRPIEPSLGVADSERNSIDEAISKSQGRLSIGPTAIDSAAIDGELVEELNRLAQERTPSSARQILLRTFQALSPKQAVLSSGLGMEGCALLDLIAPLGLPLRIVFIDTGFHFEATLDLLTRLRERYPELVLEKVEPTHSPAEQAQNEGPELWIREPDRCCQLRKIAPLGRCLTGADLWISAIGSSQSEARAAQPVLAATSRFGLPKLSPLRDWRRSEIWAFIRENDVPFNDLHLRGYPSIGCFHCTLPVPGLGPDEYSRAGRWAQSSKSECGLHTVADSAHSQSSTAQSSTAQSSTARST